MSFLALITQFLVWLSAIFLVLISYMSILKPMLNIS
nr:MAG TPA: hypothetical protein [Caudoviricetes sp.]